MKKITLVLLCCGFLLSFWGCNGSGSDYTVTTGGYGGDIAVTLTVDNGKISKIKVVGDKETEGVGSLAVQQLPAKIIDAQIIFRTFILYNVVPSEDPANVLFHLVIR